MLGDEWGWGVAIMLAALLPALVAGTFWRRGYSVGRSGRRWYRTRSPFVFWSDVVTFAIVAAVALAVGVFVLLARRPR